MDGFQAGWRKKRQPRLADASLRLAELSERAADEMDRIEACGRVWLPSPEEPDFNVIVCGAGMSGLAAAFGLKRHGVEGVALVDQRAAGEEGPWLTCARMKTLRSPKQLAGPDLGVPSLTPRSWFGAIYGDAAWAELDKLDRRDWAEYLLWFREFTRPRLFNQRRLVAIEPDPFGLALSLDAGGAPVRVRCRRLIMATGAGVAHIPGWVEALPKSLWTHSAETHASPDFEGREFLVLGAGASSLDWAVAALEGGARRVELVARETKFACTEVLDWTNFPGFLDHYPELDDARRYRFAEHYFRLKTPPTQDQFDRALAFPQFRIRLGFGVRGAHTDKGRVTLISQTDRVEADHLLLGTGYNPDLSSLEPLKAIAPLALHWRDRAPANGGNDIIGAHPYLGRGFELLAKDQTHDNWISRIHIYNNSAVPSLGPISNGVTGMKSGARRLVRAVGEALFIENADRFADALAAYAHPHFDPRGVGEPT